MKTQSSWVGVSIRKCRRTRGQGSQPWALRAAMFCSGPQLEYDNGKERCQRSLVSTKSSFSADLYKTDRAEKVRSGAQAGVMIPNTHQSMNTRLHNSHPIGDFYVNSTNTLSLPDYLQVYNFPSSYPLPSPHSWLLGRNLRPQGTCWTHCWCPGDIHSVHEGEKVAQARARSTPLLRERCSLKIIPWAGKLTS